MLHINTSSYITKQTVHTFYLIFKFCTYIITDLLVYSLHNNSMMEPTVNIIVTMISSGSWNMITDHSPEDGPSKPKDIME
jgi:hypothetical protein